MHVLPLPPPTKESLNRCVSLVSRKGTRSRSLWFFWLMRMVCRHLMRSITLLLMLLASRSRAPVLRVRVPRSEPARSTMDSLAQCRP